jgi:hypothetical protein
VEWEKETMTSYINPNGYSTMVTGQMSVSATIAQLPDNPASFVLLSAPSTNSADVFVGTAGVTDSTGLAIPKGTSVLFPVLNTNMIYVIAVGAETLSFAAMY